MKSEDNSNGKRPLDDNNDTKKPSPVKRQAVPPSHVVSIDEDDSDVVGEPMDDDMDVEVITPPRKVAAAAAIDLLSESPAAISQGNTSNPNIIYPHARTNCGLHLYETNPQMICDNCFCVVCNARAKDCNQWEHHCKLQLISKDKKKAPRNESAHNGDSAANVVDLIATREASNALRQRNRRLLERRVRDVYDEIFMGEPPVERERYGERRREKAPSEMRITEVLAERLSRAVTVADENSHGGYSSSADDARRSRISQLNMDGDIGQLKLQNSFFVEGVKIGWPFPAILPPQRQMALHIIRALKKKLHVVIESPTGTGKSAAILCSVLGWQRYQAKVQNDADPLDSIFDGGESRPTVPKIIYCSRTHSQVAQMVASLKKTPYRPRMTILGSRDRLCINRDVVGKQGININTACQDRKTETDKRRKRLMKERTTPYSDDNPHIPQEELTQSTMAVTADDRQAENGDNAGDDNADSSQRKSKKERPICTHYMNLTNKKNITGMQSRYIWETQRIASCCTGGEATKAGVHDIEDLVAFGKNPNLEKGIALYRKDGTGSFGILLENRKGGGCVVNSLRNESLVAMTRNLRPGDWIVAVNGEDTTKLDMDQMVERIKAITKDPLVLDVLREDGVSDKDELDTSLDRGYSEDALCPYFMSRALKAHADLIFAPYNYILDPSIRRSMQLPLENTIVVLDEAHNVEDTLKESGSGDYKELDLCKMMTTLMLLAKTTTNNKDDILSVEGSDGQVKENSYPEIAHSLLLFVERLVLYMRNSRIRFESSPGLEKIKSEHEKFKLADDHTVEVKYSGPTGVGLKGETVGCLPLLEELQATNSQCEVLANQAEALESHLSRKEREAESEYDATLMDVVDLVKKFALAAKNPEHFYMALNMKPNGNMDYATGMDKEEYETLMAQQRWRKKPRRLPYVFPKTEQNPNAPTEACRHEPCKTTNDKGYFRGGQSVHHGSFCDGNFPRWECHLVLRLLYPGLMLENLREKCHSVILASGSLAPIPSLCSELGLYPPKDIASENPGSSQDSAKMSQNSSELSPSLLKDSKSKASEAVSMHGRLQIRPKPLEANHVINLPKQLFAVSVGHFPDGSPLTVSYNHYKNPAFFPRLGDAIATVVETTPRGGVLIFVPSYSFLNKCVKCWNPTGFDRHTDRDVWRRLVSSKGKVIVEPTGSQEKFEEAKAEYREQINQNGKCVLLAVFRGKMSEGISFNDDNARCVICVGLPFPSFADRAIKAKRCYNDEQRKIKKNTSLLPGEEWYSQQAYRALAQALGRCIRHGADYGAVVMMDSRHCDDGSPNNGICRAHKNLPKWMRNHMRTLSIHQTRGCGSNPVVGGYEGLRRNLASFFQQAPAQEVAVRKKWKEDLEKAKQISSQSTQHQTFHGQTGNWSEAASKKEL